MFKSRGFTCVKILYFNVCHGDMNYPIEFHSKKKKNTVNAIFVCFTYFCFVLRCVCLGRNGFLCSMELTCFEQRQFL